MCFIKHFFILGLKCYQGVGEFATLDACNLDRCVKTKKSSGFEYSCQLASNLTRSGYRDNDCSRDYSSNYQWETCICDTDGCNKQIGKFEQSKAFSSIPY